MKRVVFILITLLFAAGTTDVQAQWLKKLGQKAIDRAEDRAKKKVERKVDDAVDKTVDNAFEGAEDAVKGEKKGEDGKEEAQAKPQQKESDATGDENVAEKPKEQPQSPEMAYAKSDFVAGDEIIFDDPMENEQMGEFPSQWDLLDGVADVAQFNGIKCINVENDVKIAPLMENMKSYLTDKFTVEMDFWVCEDEYFSNRERYTLRFFDAKEERVMEFAIGGSGWSNWGYTSTSGDKRSGDGVVQKLKIASWHHLAILLIKGHSRLT